MELHAAGFVLVVLLAWTALAIALGARAERRIGSLPALPWTGAGACAVLALAALATRAPASALGCGIACIALLVASIGDARTGYLFDAITFPAAVAVVAVAVADGETAAAAAGVVLLVGLFGGIVAVSRGRWMGLGDVKAMFALGAAFGPVESIVAVFVACVSGIAASAVGGRLSRGAEVRFGPHLAFGGAFALVAGDRIVHGWMGL